MSSKSSPQTRPFEISGDYVHALDPNTFTQLLRRLLCAEAMAHDIPMDSIHVASQFNAPDGGEDGYIGWEGDPARTEFLPCRKNQFQLKCGEVRSDSAAREVLTQNGEVKPKVREVLAASGCYIMLSSRTFTRQAASDREQRIRKSLCSAGMDVGEGQVHFRDADQVATWANCYPSVATWAKELTQPGAVGPFCSWDDWAGRSEHQVSSWVDDSRIPSLRTRVWQRVTEEQGVIHIGGLPGVGKSRLLLESLGPSDEKDRSICDLVMYADETETSHGKLMHTVRTLAKSKSRAIIVVDRCTPRTRRAIASAVNHQGSRLSLVTIEDDADPNTLDPQTVIVPEAPSDVTEAMVENLAPTLPSEDKRRLGMLSRGFPEVALAVVKAWKNSVPIPLATDDDIVDAFVVGRESYRSDSLMDSARLLAVFGALRLGRLPESQLPEASHLQHGLEAEALYAGIQRLVGRDVAKELGRFAAFPPNPVALRLAERQWREWTPDRWDEILAGNISPGLMVFAARRLALLNTSPKGISQWVTAHVCRHGGPLEVHLRELSSSHAEVLTALVQIDASQVVALLERSLRLVDRSKVKDEVSTHIVWTLEQAAFRKDTFEDAASMLLDHAATENESCSTRAAEAFTELFPLLLGKTEADGASRLAFLRAVDTPPGTRRRSIIVEALVAGVKTEHFHRDVGAETHGLRPTLHSWRPATTAEAAGYVAECVKLVTAFATEDDSAGEAAREGLGENLRSLVSSDLVDFELVEWVVDQVQRHVDAPWKEAIRSLNHFVRSDAKEASPSLVDRVKALVEELQPTDLKLRALHLISQRAGDYPPDEESDLDAVGKRLEGDIRKVAEELVSHPEILRSLLPEANSGTRGYATWFGECIAEAAESPLDWLDPVRDAYLEAPEGDRNSALLAGFLCGLSKTHASAVVQFKRTAAASEQLAPTLPHVCWCVGIVPDDIDLVANAIRTQLLHPRLLEQWTIDPALRNLSTRDLAPLFDAMLDRGWDGFPAAVDLICAYARDDDKLDGLWPQISRIAGDGLLSQHAKVEGLTKGHFKRLMTKILKRGHQDAKARKLALMLAGAFVESLGTANARLVKPLLPLLLEDFPDISWPSIGQAIIAEDGRHRLLLEFALGDRGGPVRKSEPAILRLPQETLFAWCQANPDRAPAFAAVTVPFFKCDEPGGPARELHPVMSKLLDQFGSRKGVLEAVSRNMGSFSWTGSATNRVRLYREPLVALQGHSNQDVRKWAKAELGALEPWIEELNALDAESQVRSDI